MKNMFSKILIFSMLLSFIMPLIVKAEEITIYNRGKVVRLEHELQYRNGRVYIHEEEIHDLELTYRESLGVISALNSSEEIDMKIYSKNNMVVVNGLTVTYNMPLIEVDGETYISIELLAMFFSTMYEISDGRIDLWISDNGYDYVRGSISLPSGKKAPAGGVEIEVFIAEKPRTSTGSGIKYDTSPDETKKIGRPGYWGGKYKPMYDENIKEYNDFLNYEREISGKFLIPEGESEVEYVLCSSDYSFEKCIVGYYCKFEGNAVFWHMNYKGNRVVHDYKMSYSRNTINGTVSIPQTADKDMQFRIVAHGDDTFACKGTIPKGESCAEFSIAVDNFRTYALELVFVDAEYARVMSDEDVKVMNESVHGIELVASSASDKYSVEILLPQGCDNKTFVDADVYLQMAEAPYYILDIDSVSLSTYITKKSVVLSDDLKCKNVICYYVLSNENEGIFKFGHYSEKGTSFNVYKADVLTPENNNISMTLLKSKEFNINFSLPGDAVAQKNIGIDVYPVTVTYPSGDGGNEGDNPFVDDDVNYPDDNPPVDDDNIVIYPDDDIIIKPYEPVNPTLFSVVHSASAVIGENKNNGTKTVSIPDEEGYGYIVEMDVYGGDDKYYGKIYYSDEKTTADRRKASEININTDTLDVELVRQFSVSGNVSAVGYESTVNRISAIAQNEDGNSGFYTYTEIDGNDAYSLYVPEEFDSYVFSLFSADRGREIYYKADECADIAENSQTVTVRDNVSGIDFVYSGYNPSLPVEINVSEDDDGQSCISVHNISDFETDDITLYVSCYDEEDKLLNIISEEIGILKAGERTDKYFDFSDECIVIRIMAWNNMKPLAAINNTYVGNIPLIYTDVSYKNPYLSAINDMEERDIMNGYMDGTFKPDGTMTREEFSLRIVFMDNKEFTENSDFECADVEKGHWSAESIKYCIEKGIFSLENGFFRPYDEITIGEAVNALMRYMGYTDYTGMLDDAREIGLLYKIPADINIDSLCKREMIAQLIYNAIIINEQA